MRRIVVCLYDFFAVVLGAILLVSPLEQVHSLPFDVTLRKRSEFVVIIVWIRFFELKYAFMSNEETPAKN